MSLPDPHPHHESIVLTHRDTTTIEWVCECGDAMRITNPRRAVEEETEGVNDE